MKRIALIAALLAFAAPALAVPAPRVKLANLADLPVVELRPYDESADAEADLAAAFARARKSHKRVLIDMGGNWCADCIILSNLMQLPEMKPFIAAHFETVVIDVGRMKKNLQIPARYGASLDGGVPAILVLTPDGKALNATKLSALEDARHMSPQGLADWLAQWAQ